MKTVVLTNELSASDMIGSELYQEYLKLLRADIDKRFSQPESLIRVACPGDQTGQGVDAFECMNFMYQQGSQCKSYYVNPRPKQDQLEQFYRESSACQFWRKETFKLPDAQLHYLCGLRVTWIMEMIDEYLTGPVTLLDYETKYPGLINQLHADHAFNQILSFQPKLYEHEHLLPKDVLIARREEELADSQADIVTALDTTERMFDPGLLFSNAARVCRSGGLLMFTTASCSGLEYQVLGKDAPNLNPINRMNLLSMEAIVDHVQRAGFEILEYSTPGRIDVDIVKQVIDQNKEINIDPFWRYVFETRTEKTWTSLQKFLQEHRLSSHVRIAARKL